MWIFYAGKMTYLYWLIALSSIIAMLYVISHDIYIGQHGQYIYHVILHTTYQWFVCSNTGIVLCWSLVKISKKCHIWLALILQTSFVNLIYKVITCCIQYHVIFCHVIAKFVSINPTLDWGLLYPFPNSFISSDLDKSFWNCCIRKSFNCQPCFLCKWGK